MEKLRVALVHDWLTGQRGGEKVLEVFAEIFPSAPIYTLIHFPGSQAPEIEKRRIETSFLQHFPGLRRCYRYYLPWYPLAAELFDLQSYDLILSSSHCVAKGVIPRPGALHICYIHSPMRYAWSQYFSYFSPDRLGLLSRYFIPPIVHRLRIWDVCASHRVDHFIANSRTVAARVERYYRRSSEVIHPPVDTRFYELGDREEDYFLIVSALVPYKRIDLAIEAFNRSGRRLKIVGIGPDYKRLKRQAGPNIELSGSLQAEELRSVYQGARALIMPGEEDFGINSLESQACGVPVITLNRGGATETVIAGETGVFFSEPNVSSLLGALDKFETIAFNKNSIRKNALTFSRETFKAAAAAYFRKKVAAHMRMK